MHAEPTDRRPLRRFPGEESTRYKHPNGWMISKAVRDWDARGLGGLTAEPKTMWEVKRFASSARRREYFQTLRAARAWCDEHERWPA